MDVVKPSPDKGGIGHIASVAFQSFTCIVGTRCFACVDNDACFRGTAYFLVGCFWAWRKVHLALDCRA